MARRPVQFARAAGGWPAGSYVPAGTHVDRRVLPRSVPPGVFLGRGRLMKVPIGPYGFAQGTIPSGTVTGSATSPGTFQIFATLAINPGTYTVSWTVTLAGTVGAGDANNFGLTLGSGRTLAAPSVNTGAAGTYAQASVTFTVIAADTITLKTWSSAPTAGATYSGTVTITGASLTLNVGPQGVGSSWDLAQVSVATTTGTADASTVAFFVQPTGTVQAPWQVGQSYAGGGDQVGLAGIKMVPGERLYAVWTSANPGDIATMILTGVMTVLT